jgi:hypothetical protein
MEEIEKKYSKGYYEKIKLIAAFSKKYIKRSASNSASFYQKITIRSSTWNKIPLFRWSVPEKAFVFSDNSVDKNGIYFIGDARKKIYPTRSEMRKKFSGIINFVVCKLDDYWKLLAMASVLVCPTESSFGDFVPTKLFEFSASGAAILTNCDLIGYNMQDLDKVVIKYTTLDDLREKLKMDFKPYYGKAREVMKNHTHKIRYKEIFE